MRKVTKDTTLAEILKHPGTSEVLSRYRFPCLHCPMAAFEIGTLKLGEVAKAYGIDLDSLLKDLNKIIEGKG